MKSPDEMRMRVVGKAAEDEEFRAKLLSEPKAAVEQELGVTMPAGLTVQVHEKPARPRISSFRPPVS